MFKYDDDYTFAKLDELSKDAVSNYVLEVNDLFLFEVYTKDGERLIDPDFELARELGNMNNNTIQRPSREYLILPDSTTVLPMIGEVKLGGLTINEANELLSQEYSQFYSDPFVLVKYANKRVIVLGGSPSLGQVIPLTNENTSVAEIIALAGGIDRNNHAENVRLIRGKEVYLIDMSTIEGYLETNQIVQSGDIVYIEPVPRVVAQSASEVSLIVSTITALTTLLILILSLGNSNN